MEVEVVMTVVVAMETVVTVVTVVAMVTVMAVMAMVTVVRVDDVIGRGRHRLTDHLQILDRDRIGRRRKLARDQSESEQSAKKFRFHMCFLLHE